MSVISVSLYNVDSEGAMLEALRFGNADIALMDGGSAWVGWQQYDLQVLAADQKSDGRTHYSAHAWVLALLMFSMGRPLATEWVWTACIVHVAGPCSPSFYYDRRSPA